MEGGFEARLPKRSEAAFSLAGRRRLFAGLSRSHRPGKNVGLAGRGGFGSVCGRSYSENPHVAVRQAFFFRCGSEIADISDLPRFGFRPAFGGF